MMGNLTGSELGVALLSALGIDYQKTPAESITVKCLGGAHMATVEVVYYVRGATADKFSNELKRYELVPVKS